MSGNSYNKTTMLNQKGQILLITIMLVATLLTIVLAVTFKSTTETQLTKLDEESQKALAAAEAGVEAALQQNTNTSLSIADLPNMSGSGFTGDATVDKITDTEFVTPLLQKDQQYTFYLSDYPGLGNPFNGITSVYFQSETDCPTLELTFLTAANVITRQLADPCNQIANSNDTLSIGGTYPLGGYNFNYQRANLIVNNQALLIIRTLFGPTRVAIERTGGVSTVLPAQGKYVTSEAKSPSGVSKKVQLFQSYPQIPAEFFVTSF